MPHRSLAGNWIGLIDRSTALFHSGGVDGGLPEGRAFAPADLMPRGSLMLETEVSALDRPGALFAYHHHHPWKRGLSLHALPDGGVALVVTQGDRVSHTVVNHGQNGQDHRLRITYVWDAPDQSGRLSVHVLGTDQHVLQPVHSPVPLSLSDVQLAFSRHLPLKSRDHGVSFVAVSDVVQPVGVLPSLAPDAPVLTATGYRPVCSLKRGDLIRTTDGEQVPVLANLSCRMPARGSLHPIRLRAPYFGLQRDVSVAAEQRLCASGSDVEFLFGAPTVLLPARHLLAGGFAYLPRADLTQTWHQLLLPRNEPILVAGARVQSLYLGRRRRQADQIAAGVLSGLNRSRLPEHARPAFPVLRAYEAITLLQHRVA